MPTVARLSLQVDVDGGAKAIAQLEAIDRALKSHAARWSQMSQRFVTDTDNQGEAMGRLTRSVETSHARIGRSTDDVVRRHERHGSILGTIGQQMARTSGRTILLTNAIGTLVPVAFQLGTALAPVVGLAGALPGLLLSGGVAIATIKLAFSGMGDALKAMQGALDGTEASQKKLNEAMAALPPAARPVARQLFEMRHLVTQLRETAAAGIMPGVADVLRSLEGLFPIVKREIGETADVMGRLATMTANWFQSPLFRRDFQTIIGTGSQVTANFGRAALSLARAFVNVAVVAEPLVLWLSRLVELGARWLEQSSRVGRETGTMAAFFQRARDVASQLWRILGDVLTIIGNLGRVARPAGEGLLDALERILDRAAKASQNIERLRDWLLLAADAFTILRLAMLGAVFGPWGVAVGAAAGALIVLYRRSETFREGIAKLWGLIQRNVIPAFQSLVGWVQDKLLPALGQAYRVVEGQVNEAVQRLSDALGENRGAFQTVGRIIVQVGGWLLLRLLPALIRVGGFFGVILINNITRAIRIFGAIVRAIQTVVGWFRTLSETIGNVVDFTARAWATLGRITQTAWGNFRRFITDILNQTSAAVVRVWNRIVGFLRVVNATIGRITKAAWDFFFELIVGNIRRVLDEVRKSIVGLIPRQVKDAWERVKDATAEAWQRVREIVGGAIGRVLRVLRDAWASMLRALRDAWTRFANVIRDAWAAAVRNTREAWDRLRTSVRDGTRRAMDTITGWGRSVRDFFSRMIRDATGWGARIWRNVRDGIGSIDISGRVRSSLNAALRLINSLGSRFASGANIILPGSPIKWPGIPLLGSSGGGGGGQPPAGGAQLQMGGLIPGPPRGDRVPIMAEGGEVMIRQQVAAPLQGMLLALNRLPGSTARALGRMMGGGFQGGGLIPGFQVGGAVGVGGRGGPTYQQIISMAQATGIPHSVVSTVRPGARTRASGALSYHATGHAVDFGGTTTSLTALTNALGSQGGWRELIFSHMPWYIGGGTRKGIGALNAITLADHWDHLHAARAAGGGAGGLGVDFGGLLRALLRKVTAPMVAGLHQALGTGPNDLLGGFAGGAGRDLSSRIGRAIPTWIKGLVGGLVGGGGGRGNLSAAESWIIQHESGGNVNADNPTSTAFGLGQLLLANRQNIGRILGFSPATTDYNQQLAMFRYYVKSRYGTAEAAQRFWQSHGWYQGGLDAVVRRPTMIGVGEAGPEHVRVTPGSYRQPDGGGTQVFNFNVSLTGTMAEPISMGDVHRAIGEAVGMLRAARARGVGVGRT